MDTALIDPSSPLSRHSALSRRLGSVLQEELLRRIRKNPSYSLRSFAIALGINSGSLSRIISGRVIPSRKTTEHLVKALGWGPAQLGVLQGAGSEPKTASHRTLEADVFRVIADWYHYAILELTTLKGFKPDHKWIAARLGLSVAEVNDAVERLLRIEFLEITGRGNTAKWKDRSGDVTTVGNDFTTAAFRKVQKQALEMGLQALEDVPFERRDHSWILFPIDQRDLPEFKSMIKNFRRSLAKFAERAERTETRTDLYQLALAFYPLTRPPSAAKIKTPSSRSDESDFKKEISR